MTNRSASSVDSVPLSELVTIKAGYPFRGSIRLIPDGKVKAVQAKDIGELGELNTNNLITTDLTGIRCADWLEKGDVLFNSKGHRMLACYIAEDLGQTTCSPSIFLMRLKPAYQGKVNPAFLAWQLNQEPTQNYFKRSAEGSFQIAIRRDVLAAANIALPSLSEQNTIASLYQASIKEHQLLHQLIGNRQRQLTALARDLVKRTTN